VINKAYLLIKQFGGNKMRDYRDLLELVEVEDEVIASLDDVNAVVDIESDFSDICFEEEWLDI
jgi:hypothetical protein